MRVYDRQKSLPAMFNVPESAHDPWDVVRYKRMDRDVLIYPEFLALRHEFAIQAVSGASAS